jgi:hypothetical protein
MKTSDIKRSAKLLLQACAMVMLLNAPGVHADEFGDEPPICMKRPSLPQCNPEPFEPPPQDPFPCDFQPFGCPWF